MMSLLTRHVILMCLFLVLLSTTAWADYRGFCSLNGKPSKSCRLEITDENLVFRSGLQNPVTVKAAEISRLVDLSGDGGKTQIPALLTAAQIEKVTGEKVDFDSMAWSVETQTTDAKTMLGLVFATSQSRGVLQIRPRGREAAALRLELERLTGKKFE